MAQRPRGICRNCGKNRAFFNEDLKLCSECDELLQKGEIEAPKEKTRGRKPDLISSNNDQEIDNKPAPQTKDDSLFSCEGCGAGLLYGQQKCSKCGIYPDWRGSSVEHDDHILICPQCGCSVGFVENPPAACPHCNYSGE